MPTTSNTPLEVVVLAAGKGTRMVSARAKVMHRLAGKPLLQHVFDTTATLAPARTHVVFGHGAAELHEHFAEADICWVPQTEQLGTGHAVHQALAEIGNDATVLVVYGDVPLIRAETLASLAGAAARSLVVLTARVDDPTGYGRIVRAAGGRVQKIVEQRDASDEELTIDEINTGFLAAPAALLRQCLEQVGNDNDQGEYYLTDIVGIAVAAGAAVDTRSAEDPWEIRGINSRAELASLERHYQRRVAHEWMTRGITIADPQRIDVRGDVNIGADCFIDVNVIIEGPTAIGDGVQIGANNIIRKSTIEAEVAIDANCIIDEAYVARGARVGPFARLRPGAEIGRQAHIGNFVEIKKSTIADGAKVNHLSYVGDSTVGRQVNIGAGVITCNYDGANKHRTDIGDDVFVGSNCQLVAPVKIGRGATIGAGSTITGDVPPDTLAVSRAEQRHIASWRRPRKKEQ